jgi:phosphatidylglycerol lysyltransferase
VIYFWENRGFCLYRTLGGYMVVFSDPSIPSGMERWFMRNLLQQAAELDRDLVFYQISAHWIPVLHDFGYSFFKLGEEAIVDFHSFSIQGNKGKAMRNVLNRLRNDGYRFEILPPEKAAQHLPELREISEEWLRSKRTGEKQFSIGHFDAMYLGTSRNSLQS